MEEALLIINKRPIISASMNNIIFEAIKVEIFDQNQTETRKRKM